MPECSFSPPPYQGPSASEVLALRKKHLSPGEFFFLALEEEEGRKRVLRAVFFLISFFFHLMPFPFFFCLLSLLSNQKSTTAMFHHFKEPIMITDGHMQYLYDERGRRFLDAFAGVSFFFDHYRKKKKS